MERGLMRKIFTYDDGVTENLLPTEHLITTILAENLKPFISAYSIIKQYDNHIFNSDVVTTSIQMYLNKIMFDDTLGIREKHNKVMNVGIQALNVYSQCYKQLKDLGTYAVTSLSTYEAMKLHDNEKLKASIETLYDDTKTYYAIDKVYKTLDEVLHSLPRGPYNTLHSSYFGGLASKKQFGQMYGTIGYPSNSDSKISATPIKASYIRGSSTTIELALGIKAAMIAAHFSTTAIRDSEYFSRRMRSVFTSLRWVSVNDCGTEEGMKTAHLEDGGLVGMYYKDRNSGVWGEWKLCTEDKSTHPKLAEPIMIRNINHCKDDRGDTVCIKCAGHMAYRKPPNMSYGTWLITKTTGTANQLTLSVKHYIESAKITLVRFLTSNEEYKIHLNNVYVKDSHAYIPNTIPRLLDVDFNTTDIQKFSSIKHVGRKHGGKVQKCEFDIAGYLTKDFLEYMASIEEMEVVGAYFRIPMNRWGNKPIIAFVSIANNFKTLGEKYRNAIEYMRKKGHNPSKSETFNIIRKLSYPALMTSYTNMFSMIYVLSTYGLYDTRNLGIRNEEDQYGLCPLDEYIERAGTCERILTGSNTFPIKPYHGKRKTESSDILLFISSYKDKMKLLTDGNLGE